jgi:hypothetical protein
VSGAAGTGGAEASGVPAADLAAAGADLPLVVASEAGPSEVTADEVRAGDGPEVGTPLAHASAMPGDAGAEGGLPVEDRFLPVGAALGVAVGPMALIGQAAAGTGDAHWYVGLIAAALGALTGGFGLPVLLRPSETGLTPDAAGPRPLTPLFGAVFLFAVGLLAGAVAAFPMGAVVASVAGLVAGPAAVFAWRLSGGRVAVAAAGSLSVGSLVALGVSP